jgi:hypothetical protein
LKVAFDLQNSCFSEVTAVVSETEFCIYPVASTDQSSCDLDISKRVAIDINVTQSSTGTNLLELSSYQDYVITTTELCFDCTDCAAQMETILSGFGDGTIVGTIYLDDAYYVISSIASETTDSGMGLSAAISFGAAALLLAVTILIVAKY